MADTALKADERPDVTEGTEVYRDFVIDNVYHSADAGDIHYNVYIPKSYDGSKPYALYFTLPGYEGLYFRESLPISSRRNLDLRHRSTMTR